MQLTKLKSRSCPFESDEAYAIASRCPNLTVVYDGTEQCYLIWDMKADRWVADPTQMPKKRT